MPGNTLALILAAGAGTRLRPLTDTRPKCLLEVGGRPLLDYQLDALAARGVEEVLVVTGHEAEQIRRRYARRLRTLYDPDYATTNNLHSLWTARRQVAGRDVVCLHADILFHPAILQPCLESPSEVTVILDRVLVEETMKARVEDGRVMEVGKDIPAEKIFATFLGIARFAPPASAVLPEVLEALLRDDAHRQSYFTACLPALGARGFRVGYTLTNGQPWIEIDFRADLDRAATEILPLLLAGLGKSF